MKKKPLLLVSVFLLILFFSALHSTAEPAHVYRNVQTGDTYWNLDTALYNAINGQAIELIDAVTITNPISVTGKAITIDLNSYDMEVQSPISINNNGALVIEDVNTSGGAVSVEISSGTHSLYADNGSKLNIDGKIIVNENHPIIANNNSEIVVKDVDYTGGETGVIATSNSIIEIQGSINRTGVAETYYAMDQFQLNIEGQPFYFSDYMLPSQKSGYITYSDSEDNSIVYLKNNWLCNNGNKAYTNLTYAFEGFNNGDTLNILKSFSWEGSLEIGDLQNKMNGKNITLQTNGFSVDITSISSDSKDYTLQLYDSVLTVTGNGELNLIANYSDDLYILEAVDSTANITSITAGSNAVNAVGILAKENSSIFIEGSIDTKTTATNSNSSIIEIAGSITTTNGSGVYATNSSNITIDGNIESYYYGVQSYGSNVNVKGDIISDSLMSTGVEAHSSSDVTIEKNIETKVGATLYDDDTLVTVNGSILSDEFAYIDALEALDSDITKSGGYDVYRKSHLTASLRVKSPYWGVEIDSENYYPFEGGNGQSLEEAYEISTANQLAQLSYNVRSNIDLYTEKFFVLTNDIDLSGKEWMPIGYRNYSEGEEYGFNGYFDGDGYTISNLTVGYSDARSELDQIGLFGAIKHAAEIKNTYIEDVVIYAHNSDAIGALVGYSESRGAITNCAVTGSINSTGTNGSVGGIVGKTDNMQTDNLRSDIDIRLERVNSVGGVIGYFGAHSYDVLKLLNHSIYSGNIYINGYVSAGAGGIVGQSYGYALILNSINNGSIELDTSSGQGNLGGIAGKIHNEVANCYSTGGISAYNGNIGGIVGFADHGGNIYNSYSSGYTISSGSKTENFGGIVGYANSNVEFVNCYFNTQKNSSLPLVSETNDNVSINNCYELTTIEMQGNVLNAPIYYNDNLAVSGENGFTNALNMWIETQDDFQDMNFSEWERLDAFNNKYPFLVKTTEKDPLHNSKAESILVDISTLNPSFNSDNYEYTVSVEDNVESINISANPASPRSTVLIDQTQTNSKNIPLETSATTILIKITSNSNVFSTEYSIVINKAKKISSPASKPSAPVIIVVTETKDGKVTNSTDIKPAIVNKRISSFITPAVLDKLIETAKETNGIKTEDDLILQYLDNTGIDEQRIVMQRNGLIKITQETDSNLNIHTNMLEMIFSKESITNITEQLKNRNVIFNVSSNDAHMKDEVINKYKDRPKYKISIEGENKAIKELSNGKVKVTFPYMLKKDEHPYAVVIKHIDEDGNEKIIKGIYNQDNRSITASIDKLGTYIIDHKLVEFEDVDEGNQYKDAIVFSAARQITSGTGNNQYSPKAKLTRGQFIVMIMDAYNIKNLEGPTISNFLDAGETYYTPYLHTARQLGLVNGVGNDLYLPNNEISNQEALAMLANIFRIKNAKFLEDDSKKEANVKDLDTISNWARKSVIALYKYNIALENEGYLNAKNELLREEYAQIIYNILSK